MTKIRRKEKEIVVRIISGDTFETEKGETIRIAGANAPRLGEFGCEEAINHLIRLIEGKEVDIHFLAPDSNEQEVANVFIAGESVAMGMRSFVNAFYISNSKINESKEDKSKTPEDKKKKNLFETLWQEIKSQAIKLISKYILYFVFLVLGLFLSPLLKPLWTWLKSNFWGG